MKRQGFASVVMVSSLLLLPPATWAQTLVSGSIAGVVRDATGAVVPGVTVEAASPALIEKVRTGVTDDQGQYRIVDLRPGLYTVTFTLAGFSTLKREGIELTTNFTAPVNAELRVGSLEETVTVSGESPMVDVQNVVQQKVLSRDLLDSVPSGKALQAFAALTVGLVLPPQGQDVGGNRGEAGVSFSAHGAPGGPLLQHDGMRYGILGGAGGASRGLMINAASTQEVTLEISGISAESESGGIQLNLVPKEGGNTFAGYFLTSYTNHDLQNGNLTDTLRARDLTAEAPVREIYDFNMALGGPIKQDKLWFFSAHRWWGASQFAPGNYYNKTIDSWFYTPDLSRPAYTHDYNRDHNLRLTWQASQKNKVNVFHTVQYNCTCHNDILDPVTVTVAPEASRGTYYQNPNYLLSATWSYPATNRLLFEVGAALMKFHYATFRQPGVSFDDIAITELSRNYQYNARAVPLTGGQPYGHFRTNQTNQRFAVSYITGSHAFKAGLFSLEGWGRNDYEINGDVSYAFRNGVPTSVTQWATPVGIKNRVTDIGIYTQDQWTIRKLTLNLGGRFDYLNAWVPETHLPAGRFVPARDFAAVLHVPTWTDLSPRLGAAYDLFGTGKTAFKVSLGRYVAGEVSTVANASNPVNASVNSATRTWTDENGDFIPQPSELGALSNASFGKVDIRTRYADDVREGFGKRGYNWQASASIQHEIRPGIALSVGYFRTWYGNFTATDNLAVTPADHDPYCMTAPVDARLPGGGGNQLCGLYDVTLGKFGQVNNLITFEKPFGTRSQVFNGVDVTMNARFGQGGLLSGGLSTGATVTDTCFVVDSPQALRDGFCHVSPPWSAGTQVKFSGAYPLPWDLQTSATFQYLPGIPIAASYVATSAQIAPSLGRNLSSGANGTVTIDLIEPNTLFEDRITQLDVRLTKIFRVGRTRVQGMFDVYNVLNASPILAMNTRYGPTWLVPTQILVGRLFKFGAQFDF